LFTFICAFIQSLFISICAFFQDFISMCLMVALGTHIRLFLIGIRGCPAIVYNRNNATANILL